MQLKSTEIVNTSVKGYGDFADEAFADYRKKLRTVIEMMEMPEVEASILKLSRVTPECRNMKLQPG